jgi:hypothetical protein
MVWARNLAVVFVALQHLGFLVLEMFLFQSPTGRRIFRTTPEFAAQAAPLAANQGLYNGFLAAGLVWSLLASEPMAGASAVLPRLRGGGRGVRRGDGGPADPLDPGAPRRSGAAARSARPGLVSRSGIRKSPRWFLTEHVLASAPGRSEDRADDALLGVGRGGLPHAAVCRAR